MLLRPDPILDAYQTRVIKPTSKRPIGAKIVMYPEAPFSDPEARELAKSQRNSDTSASPHLRHLPPAYLNSLYRFPLIIKRVVQQTTKGKIASMYALVVTGNGNGLVGFGQGKDENAAKAIDKAYVSAIKNMDTVNLFESRTIWSEIKVKFGATRIVMRPRPSGFGLACNPYLHQVCKAAGIRDLSAKVHGSRNGMQIVKAAMMALQGGSTPLGIGNGVGGKGKREEAKEGMRGREDIERERGRSLIEGSGWL
jgi:small subunit ribosomal protein S5